MKIIETTLFLCMCELLKACFILGQRKTSYELVLNSLKKESHKEIRNEIVQKYYLKLKRQNKNMRLRRNQPQNIFRLQRKQTPPEKKSPAKLDLHHFF